MRHTTDAAAHASAIRGALTWLREAIADTDNASELGKTARLIHTHLDALDAARVAAEARERAWQWYAEDLEGEFAGACNVDYPEGYDYFSADQRSKWRDAQDPEVARWLPNIDGTMPGDPEGEAQP